MGINDVLQYSAYNYVDKKSSNRTFSGGRDIRKAENTKSTAKNTVDKFERGKKLATYDLSKLSQQAQDYLKQLKEKFGDMDIIIANYDTEEEAQQYIAQGKKDFNVVIEPDLLEKMAADEETRVKYESVITGSQEQLSHAVQELGEDSDKVISMGITIDGDGEVSYFAVLDEQRMQEKERLQNNAEKKAEEKKTEAKKAQQKEKKKQQLVKANSIEELIEKIKNSKSSMSQSPFLFAQMAQEEEQKGGQFDYSL